MIRRASACTCNFAKYLSFALLYGHTKWNGLQGLEWSFCATNQSEPVYCNKMRNYQYSGLWVQTIISSSHYARLRLDSAEQALLLQNGI